MKKITVRKCQKLYEIIKQIVDGKDMFYVLYIDNTLIDKSKLLKQSCNPNYEYCYEEDGYKLILADDENTGEWYVLWYLINSDEEYVYSLGDEYLLDYLHGKCEYEEFYIRKWGSKTEIDEG